MKRWRSCEYALGLMLVLYAAALIGCSQATPTPKPTLAPTAVAAATQPPTVTPLPPTVPVETANPTDSPTPAVTVQPTGSPTPTVTATRARAAATKATASPSQTATALKYNAPVLLEPSSKDTRIEGKDDLVLKWKPVADLDKDECYHISLLIINNIDQRYSPFTQIVESTCNSSQSVGNLQFKLNRPRFATPNYGGLIADAQKFTPTNSFTVRWWVTVVRNDGTPLSPDSAKFEFSLNSP